MKKKGSETSLVVPATQGFIERRIYSVRGHKVMLDEDLAELYQIPTKVLNQAVRRNVARFPKDFLIKLDLHEAIALKSQFVTSNVGRGGKRKGSFAFTELGVSMLSSVLHSDRAVQMNIYIMRTFVALRESLVSTKKISEKIDDLKKVQNMHSENLNDLNIAVTKLVKDAKHKSDAIGFEV